MSDRPYTQRDGNIVFAAPAVAARLAERAPEPERVYTFPGLPEDKAYIVNLDALYAFPGEPWLPERETPDA